MSHSNSIHPKEQWSCLQEKKYYTFMAWKMNTVLIYLNFLPMFVQSHQEYWEFLYHLNILSISNTCICSNIMFRHWIIQSDNLSQTGNFNHRPLNLKSSGNFHFSERITYTKLMSVLEQQNYRMQGIIFVFHWITIL